MLVTLGLYSCIRKLLILFHSIFLTLMVIFYIILFCSIFFRIIYAIDLFASVISAKDLSKNIKLLQMFLHFACFLAIAAVVVGYLFAEFIPSFE